MVGQQASAQLRERDEVNFAGSASQLRSLQLRGSSAVLTTQSCIEAPYIISMVPMAQPRAVEPPDLAPLLPGLSPGRSQRLGGSQRLGDSRHLLSWTEASAGPSLTEHGLNEVALLGACAEAQEAELAEGELGERPAAAEVLDPWQAAQTPIPGTGGALRPRAGPAPLSHRARMPSQQSDWHSSASSSVNDAMPVRALAMPRAQLNDFGAALEFVDMLEEPGDLQEESNETSPNASTGAPIDDLPNLASLASLVEDGSLWDQLSESISSLHAGTYEDFFYPDTRREFYSREDASRISPPWNISGRPDPWPQAARLH